MSIHSYLTWFRGEDVLLRFRMQPPTDISGWALTFTLKDTLTGTTQFTKTTGGGGITLVDAGRGVFEVTIASANTSSLTAGRYMWDVRRTTSGSKTTLADGYLDLKQEVTA